MKKIIALFIFSLITSLAFGQTFSNARMDTLILRVNTDTVWQIRVSGDTIFINSDTLVTVTGYWTITGDDIANSNAGHVTIDSLYLTGIIQEQRVGRILQQETSGRISWTSVASIGDTISDDGFIKGTGAAGQVAVYASADSIAGSDGLVYQSGKLGVGMAAPESVADFAGSFARSAYATVITSSLDLQTGSNGNYYYYYTDPGGVALDITLPGFTATTYREYVVINADAANNTTLKVQSGEKLNGVTDGTFTITPLDACWVHNTGVGGIGWFTVIFGTR